MMPGASLAALVPFCPIQLRMLERKQNLSDAIVILALSVEKCDVSIIISFAIMTNEGAASRTGTAL